MNMIEKVAKAILDAAVEDAGGFGFVSDDGDGKATLDGSFDIIKVARAAIEAMREPTDLMEYAIDRHCNFMPRAGDGKRAWQKGIEAALESK